MMSVPASDDQPIHILDKIDVLASQSTALLPSIQGVSLVDPDVRAQLRTMQTTMRRAYDLGMKDKYREAAALWQQWALTAPRLASYGHLYVGSTVAIGISQTNPYGPWPRILRILGCGPNREIAAAQAALLRVFIASDEPTRCLGYLWMGVLCEQVGQPDLARSAYDRAQESAGNDPGLINAARVCTDLLDRDIAAGRARVSPPSDVHLHQRIVNALRPTLNLGGLHLL